jgi:hypothetical protein
MRRGGYAGRMKHESDKGVRQLHTVADDEEPLTRREADVAGITTTPEMVYGESDEDPNREDQQDAHHGADG